LIFGCAVVLPPNELAKGSLLNKLFGAFLKLNCGVGNGSVVVKAPYKPFEFGGVVTLGAATLALMLLL
jgi:hypothetical protein